MPYPGYQPVHEPYICKIVNVHWKKKKPQADISVTFIRDGQFILGPNPGNTECNSADKITASGGILGNYQEGIHFIKSVFETPNIYGATMTLPDIHWGPWKVGTLVFIDYKKQIGPASSATFDLIGPETLQGYGCYHGSTLGLPGLLGMDFQVKVVGTVTATINAPPFTTPGPNGRRYQAYKYEFTGGAAPSPFPGFFPQSDDVTGIVYYKDVGPA
jgi:hypothetical protein